MTAFPRETLCSLAKVLRSPEKLFIISQNICVCSKYLRSLAKHLCSLAEVCLRTKWFCSPEKLCVRSENICLPAKHFRSVRKHLRFLAKVLCFPLDSLSKEHKVSHGNAIPLFENKIMQSFSAEHHTFAREIQSVSGGTQYFCERDLWECSIFARELKNISCPLRASIPDQP